MTTKAQKNRAKSTPKFAVRAINRCERCGRRRSYLRKFRLCRICFRHMAHSGLLPGVVKASW